MIKQVLKFMVLISLGLSTFCFSKQLTIRESKSLYRSNPNFENLVIVGNAYFRSGKYKSSIKVYKQALKHKEADRGFLNAMIGFAYFNLIDDDRAYNYLYKSKDYENSEALNKQVDSFLNQIDLKYEDAETEKLWSFTDLFFLELDLSRAGNSNPSARSSTDEDEGLEIESDIHNNFSYYLGFNFLNSESFSSSLVYEKYDEYYNNEGGNNNFSENIQVPLNFYVENLILNYKFNKQRDYDNEATATLETQTSTFGITADLTNSEFAVSYSTALIDDVNEDYYYLKGSSTSYSLFYTYFIKKLSFYISYDRYDQNLNDDEYYYESNTGQTLSTGIQYEFRKLVFSFDLSSDSKTFVKDDYEEEQRIDKNRTNSFNIEYRFRASTSVYANYSRSVNTSTFDGDSASVDYNYNQSLMKVGLLVAF